MCSNNTVKNIAKNWKIDALVDDISKYFYSYEEVSSVLSGDYCFVIGRKGSGKSALCKHVLQKEKESQNVFAEILSFKSFSMNSLYNYGKKNSSTSYMALWKYFIFLKVCKMFLRNMAMNISGRSDLEKLFPKYSSKELLKEINEYRPDSFTIKVAELFGEASLLSANVGIKKHKIQNTIPLAQRAEIIENIVFKHCDKESTYYLVFDELDEEYKNIKDLNTGSKYHDLLVGLLRSVMYVKSIAIEYGVKIIPIVFLRDDIYNNIQFSDKNKWYDYKLHLDWTKDKLKRLLTYRIMQDNQQIGDSFEIAIKSIFSESLAPEVIFTILLDLSQNRPRDIIMFIKECCIIANKSGQDKIDSRIMRSAERVYSGRLKQEIIDEIHTVLPNYNDVISLLIELTDKFGFEEFEQILYKHQSEYNKLNNEEPRSLFDILFDYSIVGNINYHYWRWTGKYKYMDPELQPKFDKDFVIHPGLLASLFEKFNYIPDGLEKFEMKEENVDQDYFSPYIF